MLGAQRLFEQDVVLQVDLRGGEVVRGAAIAREILHLGVARGGDGGWLVGGGIGRLAVVAADGGSRHASLQHLSVRGSRH